MPIIQCITYEVMHRCEAPLSGGVQFTREFVCSEADVRATQLQSIHSLHQSP